MAKCKRCGAEIVPVTAWVEADVAEQCDKEGRVPFIIHTNLPMPSNTAAAGGWTPGGYSYPCRHEPEEEEL